jgi:hypothetical protein
VCDSDLDGDGPPLDDIQEKAAIFWSISEKMEQRIKAGLEPFDAASWDIQTRKRVFQFEYGLHFARGGRNGKQAFTITRGNKIAWVPSHSLPDDEIAIFRGAQLPYVLRRDGAGRFKIIGECYLHGLMHGESDRAGEYTEQEIEIV